MTKEKKSVVAPAIPLLMLIISACYGSITPEDGTDGADPDVARDDSPDPLPDDGPPPPPPRSADVLVVVDNSSSMSDEQETLLLALPTLIEALLVPPVDPATGEPVRDPFLDLHVGVVSTNLGSGGYMVDGCTGVGDDGVLLHASRDTDCDGIYPKFLSLETEEGVPPGSEEMSGLLEDLACIAALGTGGCGFEQPLEAAYRALVVNTRPGWANEGFLRQDSLLVILFVSDEDDCSTEDDALFNLDNLDYSVNLRCFMEKEMLYPVSRYVDGFRGLRASPDRLVVGIVAGVPDNEVCSGSGDSVPDCLNHEDMQEVIRPDQRLLEYVCIYPPACTPPEPPFPGTCDTEAFPARRFVELAQGLGASAVIHSACTASYRPMIYDVIFRISEIMR